MKPGISIIIPVYNEEEGLPALFARLYPALDALGEPYEEIGRASCRERVSYSV